MAHQVLYRQWRPQTFDQIVEQTHTVAALRQAVISGQISHAYCFSGTRGTGKTTLAKIFSRAINCLNPQNGNPCNECANCLPALSGQLMDIVEMDAASNNSVDNIRRLTDEIVFMPVQARYKVYIIDEVHMLSTGAFNALLKTLEEPPAHAVFILATTEANRIPATVLSRCQRYEFRRITAASIKEQLKAIAIDSNLDITDEALKAIAVLADGALRDAISFLDQARSAFNGSITRDQILSLLGVAQDSFLMEATTAIFNRQEIALLECVEQLVLSGRDLIRFVIDLAQYLRDILVCQMADDATAKSLLLRVSSDSLSNMQQLAKQIESRQLIALIRGLSALLGDLRWTSDMRTGLEIGLIRLAGELGERPAGEPVSAPQIKPVVVEKKPVSPKPVEKQIPTAEQAEPSAEDKELSDRLWQQVQAALKERGHMTLFLFSQPARVTIDNDTFRLVFDPQDQVHYQAVNQADTIKTLHEIIREKSGKSYQVQVQCARQTEQEPDRKQESWIEKARQAAEQLGVPVEVKE